MDLDKTYSTKGNYSEIIIDIYDQGNIKGLMLIFRHDRNN